MAVGFVAAGTAVAGSTTLTVAWPGSQSAGDIGLMLIETANAATVVASGWTELSTSPVESAASTHGLHVLYKIAAGSDADVSVSGLLNHAIARILVFSGVDGTSPINATSNQAASTTTTITLPSVTTDTADCAIVHVAGTGRDSISTTTFSGWTNANLASITEVADDTTGTGGGGGFGAAWGILASAGASGAGSCTQATSIVCTAITVALKPAGGGATNTDTAAGGGSIAITGSAASALRTHLGIAAASSITITGSAANGIRTLLTAASSGSIALTGSEASGVYTPVGALTSAADSGSISVTGVSAIGKHDYLAAAGSGSITITGSAANAAKSLGSTADSGSILLTGSNTLAIKTWLSDAEVGGVSLSGSDANGVKATPGTGSLDEATILAIAEAVWADPAAISAHAKLDEILACCHG